MYARKAALIHFNHSRFEENKMDYLICRKCKKMNSISAISCSRCGESLLGVKVIQTSKKVHVKSSINVIRAKTPKEAYIAFIMGVVFIFIPASLILAKNLLPVAGQVFCSLPILLGIGLIVLGINMVRHPERHSKPAARVEATQAHVKCSVCNRTNADYLRDLKRKDPNIYIISEAFIGSCPVCKKAYCVEHAAFDANIDHEVCPVHKEKLIVA